MVGGDLLLGSNDPVAGAASEIHRRHAGAWTKETAPPGLANLEVYGGGSATWAVADDADETKVLLRRSGNGTWSKKAPPGDGSSLGLRSVWSSPSGETFMGTSRGVLRTKDGVTWTDEPRPEPVVSLWGRSSTDVWAIEGTSTLVHYDGKAWSTLDEEVAGAQYVTGTTTDVLVLSAVKTPQPEPDDDDR
jgi:hypothetical protein